jgi:hypothetical protein
MLYAHIAPNILSTARKAVLHGKHCILILVFQLIPDVIISGINGFLWHIKENHLDRVPDRYRFGPDSAQDPGNELFEKMRERNARYKLASKEAGEVLTAADEAIIKTADEA